MSKILPLHLPAIPVGVMNALVTCIATISKDNRRCLRPKVHGSDYCSTHHDVVSSAYNKQKNVKDGSAPKRKYRSNENEDIARQCKKGKPIFKSIASLKDDVSIFFRKMSPFVKNLLKWNIQSIEDTLCSERNMPFALGLQVRRYFPGYGMYVWFRVFKIHSLYLILSSFTCSCRFP